MPILDDDTHHRLVALYAARRPGRQPSGWYMLTGIAVCGICGRACRASGWEDWTRHYWCKACARISVDVARLDIWAADWSIRELSDPAHAQSVERAQRERNGDVGEYICPGRGDRGRCASSCRPVRARRMTLARYDAITGPLDKRLAALRAELDALDVEPASYSPRLFTPREAERFAWLIRWDEGDEVERRGIVKLALHGRRIVVGPGRSARFDPERCRVV